MKRLLGGVGIVIFWLAWPLWVVYFKLHTVRSRVVLVCDGEVLLVRGIINRGVRWSLPGGGCNKNESPEDCAVREVREETGISLDTGALQPLGEAVMKQSPGVAYTGVFFIAKFAAKPEVRLQKHEILHAQWIPVKSLSRKNMEDDAAHGLAQAGLLPL